MENTMHFIYMKTWLVFPDMIGLEALVEAVVDRCLVLFSTEALTPVAARIFDNWQFATWPCWGRELHLA